MYGAFKIAWPRMRTAPRSRTYESVEGSPVPTWIGEARDSKGAIIDRQHGDRHQLWQTSRSQLEFGLSADCMRGAPPSYSKSLGLRRVNPALEPLGHTQIGVACRSLILSADSSGCSPAKPGIKGCTGQGRSLNRIEQQKVADGTAHANLVL